MITLVEPKGFVIKLWGKQLIKKEERYRLMRYVLWKNYDNKIMLHNVITGQLIILDQEEMKLIDQLPCAYSPALEQLIENHFLVPLFYDEHDQVLKLRTILLRIDAAQGETSILHYTVLPTTACNARCYYCFEQGTKISTMSEKTANNVVKFMTSHCSVDKTVEITWFGGEPTVAVNRIDQICRGLQRNGINYRSKMYTNGYLFDPKLVSKAKELWKLHAVQICVDGTASTYNKIKAYASAKDNPYERVMRNVGLLLKRGIIVSLRMNFDLGNYQEFIDLATEVKERFGRNKLLLLSAHPVIGEYRDPDGRILHADDEWFSEKIVELNSYASENNMGFVPQSLPFLNADTCSAFYSHSITIRPDGGLSRCSELFEDKDISGSLEQGIIYRERDRSWKEIADYSFCKDCVLFPHCVRLVNCPNKTYCHKLRSHLDNYDKVMKNTYCIYQSINKEGGDINVNART